MRFLPLLLLLAAPLAAQDAGLEERVRRLEKLIEEERGRAAAREKRINELEEALQKATDTLAAAVDRRGIAEEVDRYLDETRPGLGDGGLFGRRLSIGGVIVGSYRATIFSGSSDDENTFELDDSYLRVVYRFADNVTARYYTDGSLAELEYDHSDLLRFNVGRVVVPFGQFNPRSFADTFDTLSRPILYVGDNAPIATPANNPGPVFRTIYTDTGFVISGNRWKNGDQLYYAAFVTNGLAGTSDLGTGASFSDNNDSKQIGARLAYTITSPWIQKRLGFGISWMTGKYDANDALSYRMYGADFIYVAEGLFGESGSLTIRGEYVYAPRETNFGTVADPTTRINDAKRVQGAYLITEVRFDRRWMVYVEFDWLSQRAPLLSNGLQDPASSNDVTSTNWRGSIGLVRFFEVGIVWKLEYAYWDFDQGAPDAQFLSTQFVVPF